MAGLKINMQQQRTALKDLGTGTLLAAGIIFTVLAIYSVQHLFYNWGHRSGLSSVTGENKITGITSDDVFDLSGSQASGQGDPMKLFDENTDPANGQPGDPKTNPSPPAKIDIFYPPGKGYRIVIDLHDLYALTSIYFYDRSFESDSLWLYTGELNHWKQVAAYATTAHTSAWGWQHYAVAASSRFVMIRFNSYKAIVSELALYGTMKQKLTADLPKAATPLPPPTLRSFAGTNGYDYVSPALMKPFSQLRLYQQINYFDTDTVHAYPQNQLTLNVFNVPKEQQLRYYADSLRRQGGHLWMSIRGQPTIMEKKGINEKDKPVTVTGMDTEDPLSYGRHAKLFWTMAALFGQTRVDTSLIDVTDAPRFSGSAVMDRFENGNEEDAYWTRYYWTPTDYFAISSADYDGHEGRLGPGRGLKAADKNSKLMMSGMIQLDTNRVKTLYFLCRQLRKDKKFIWEGGVQYHYYSNAQKSNLQSPTMGISPESDHLRATLAQVKAFHNRLLPGIPVVLGENGYDRNQRSWQRTPLLPGYNPAQSQGIMCIRSLIAAFMSGFDGYNQYMMRNATNDESAPGPYATSGVIGGPATNTIYPLWYYWSTVITQLGDYLPDSVMAESGPVWIYRFKQQNNPAKKAYFLVSPTTNGSLVKNFSLKPDSINNHMFKQIILTDNSLLGTVKTMQMHDGKIVLDIGESPVIVKAD